MMATPYFVLCTGLWLAAAAPAQDPAPERPQEPRREAAARSAAEHVQRLGSDSFRERTEAERALRAMGQEALPELRKAAEDDSNAEAQWRARRLIRQIERGEARGLGRRDREERPGAGAQEPQDRGGWPRGRTWTSPMFDADLQEQFERLFSHLERDLGMDVPRARFFSDDFFQDLEAQMEELRSRMQAPGLQGMGKGFSLQMGPDGVRVEFEESGEDGKSEKKVYEAPDLETFREKYPGVLEQHGLRGGMGLWFGQTPGLPDVFHFRRDGLLPLERFELRPLRGFDRGLGGATDVELQVPPAHERLGVQVRSEIPAEVRDYLGIDHGLWVEEVQDDSLAAEMGIEPGDIVTEVGERAIHSVPDVAAALRSLDAGETVHVKVLRKGRELRLEGRKAAPATGEERSSERPAEGDEQDKGGSSLRRRGTIR